MDELLTLMLCVNDEHGNSTGQVEAVELCVSFDFEPLIRLESAYWDWGPACRLLKGETWDSAPRWKIKISRRAFPIKGYRTWAGNWCWDAAIVDLETANQILAYLKSQHDPQGNPYWVMDCAWTEIYDAWEKNTTIDLADYIKEQDYV